MFITKKHLSRRTFLRGLECAVGLPLLDAMIPARYGFGANCGETDASNGLRVFPTRLCDGQVVAQRVRLEIRASLSNPQASGTVQGPVDHRQRPEKQTGREHIGACDDCRNVVDVHDSGRQPDGADRSERGPVSRPEDRPGYALSVAGTFYGGRRPVRSDARMQLRLYRRVPYGDATAADGVQPAEGVLPTLRSGRHAARTTSDRR